MPVTLTLHRVPLPSPPGAGRFHGQRLHAAVAAVRSQMAMLWQTVFMDFRQSLSQRAAQVTLQTPSLFVVEAFVQQQWEQHVTQPVRQWLPALVTHAHDTGATATVPTLHRLGADAAWTYRPGSPAITQALAYYVGQEERRIWQTTLRSLRQGLRWSLAQAMSPAPRSRWVQTIAALTPRQVQRLQTLLVPPSPLVTHTRVRVTSAVSQHAQRGVMLRAQQISQTEHMTSVQTGQQAALMQAVQQTPRLSEDVRRFWRVSLRERTCFRCLNVVQTHPLGVGVSQPFQTFAGPVLFPPLHPSCACTVILRHVRTQP